MATVPVAGYIDVASTTNSNSRQFTLPAIIQPGSLAYVLVAWGSGTSVTATLSGWTLVDGPYNSGNSTANWSLFSKSVGTADEGDTHTISFSSGVQSAVGGIVALASLDSISEVDQDIPGVTTSPIAGFTPEVDDCLAVSFVSGYHASGATPGGTPSSGWTRRASSSTTPTTQAILEQALDTKQLTGQAGIEQSATSIDWTASTRTAKWVLTLAPIAAPTAAFTATPGGLGVSVDGTDSEAVSPATLDDYDWDWGDATTHGSGSTDTHTYSASGTYTVTLTVTDSNGLTSVTSHDVTVVAGDINVIGFINANSEGSFNTLQFDLPDGIENDSVAYVQVSWTNGSTVTASISGWTVADGPYNVSNSGNFSLFKRDVDQADSGSTHTISFSSSSPSSCAGIVALATQDTAPAHTADTSNVTTSTVAGFTPVADDSLAVSLIGAFHSANTDPGGTAATGWTRFSDAQSQPTTSGQSESLVDVKQLAGQGGDSQSSTTVSWNSGTRTSKWILTLAAAPAPAPTTADAGDDQDSIDPFDLVVLDGTGSFGPIVGYAWTQTDGATVTLSDDTASQPTFTAPATVDGDTLTFSLVVTDGDTDSDPDTVDITILPHTIWRITSGDPEPLELIQL